MVQRDAALSRKTYYFSIYLYRYIPRVSYIFLETFRVLFRFAGNISETLCRISVITLYSCLTRKRNLLLQTANAKRSQSSREIFFMRPLLIS